MHVALQIRTWLLEYIARNNDALETLVNEHHVELSRKLPDDVITKASCPIQRGDGRIGLIPTH